MTPEPKIISDAEFILAHLKANGQEIIPEISAYNARMKSIAEKLSSPTPSDSGGGYRRSTSGRGFKAD